MGWPNGRSAGCRLFLSLGISLEAAERRPLLAIVNGSTLDPLRLKSMCLPTFLVDTIVALATSKSARRCRSDAYAAVGAKKMWPPTVAEWDMTRRVAPLHK